MAEMRVASRALYRSLLRAAGRLQSEIERHAAFTALSDHDLSRLTEACPEAPHALKAVKAGEASSLGALKHCVRSQFRRALDNPGSTAAQLDLGFKALSTINNRVSVLERLASEPRSVTTSNNLRVIVSAARASPVQPVWTSFAVPNARHQFNYSVELQNLGDEAVTLVSRHWRILDADGNLNEVNGPGVRGEQPRIEPGSSFKYQSSVPIGRERGSMWGSYSLITESGQLVEATIDPFALR